MTDTIRIANLADGTPSADDMVMPFDKIGGGTRKDTITNIVRAGLVALGGVTGPSILKFVGGIGGSDTLEVNGSMVDGSPIEGIDVFVYAMPIDVSASALYFQPFVSSMATDTTVTVHKVTGPVASPTLTPTALVVTVPAGSTAQVHIEGLAVVLSKGDRFTVVMSNTAGGASGQFGGAATIGLNPLAPITPDAADASESTHGLMSAADKTKLDGLPTSAVASTDPTATPTANAIPKADGSGKLDNWISIASTSLRGLIGLSSATPNAISTAGSAGASGNAADALHTHAITAATIISAMASAASALAMNAQKITGVADPTSAQDAATKKYVDTVVFTAVKTAAYTVLAGDRWILVDDTSGRVDLTMPALDGVSRIIQKVGGGTGGIRLIRSGTEKINTVAASYDLPGSTTAFASATPQAWTVCDNATDRFVV